MIEMHLGATNESESNTAGGIRLPFTERGALRLFVTRDSFVGNLRDSIAIIAHHVATQPSEAANNLLPRVTLTRSRVSGRSLVGSLLLHCSLIGLLIYLPRAIPADVSPVAAPTSNAEIIYYRIPLVRRGETPRLSRARSVRRAISRPASASAPVLAVTVPHIDLPIISTPAHPDNSRQTIYQKASPPDVRIAEQKLPNIIFEHRQQALENPLSPSSVVPALAERRLSSVVAPSVSNANAANPLMSSLAPSKTKPILAIPLEGGGVLVERAANRSEASGGGLSADAPDVVVLSVDPANPVSSLALPAGNRLGEFAMAPSAQGSSSPGGIPHRAARGSGGSADGTLGAPPDVSDISANGPMHLPVSVAGSGAGGSGGVLDPALLLNIVYPVTTPPIQVRRKAIVISAGPLGGGGLDTYGALKCGKVYSIFLPMPQKDWSLQYCDASNDSHAVSSHSTSDVVVFDHPMVPPDADLSHRFNFKRMPLPPNDPHRAIVLKGVIAADGSIHHLVVYKGASPAMDEAARVAFSHWRFKPAIKDGKPVAVKILVGIPL